LNETLINKEASPVSCGRYIRAIRERKGIDLETVSEALKVSHRQLSLIEEDAYDELPDDIYLKGVLRAYADYIGIDVDDLFDRYAISRAAHTPYSPSTGKKGRGVGAFLRRLALPLFLLASIGAASVAAFYYWKDALPRQPGREQPTRDIHTQAGPQQRDSRQDGVPGDLVLVIDAVEKTWIKINIDGEEPLEYLLRPKDHVELEADSHFSLLIGNAGGLKMHLNGRSIEIPGKKGEVVSMELSREEESDRLDQDAERAE
jgi:transcriptional regulator with XRE-family HTH domain